MLFQMVSHMTKFNASCRKKLTFKLSKKKKTPCRKKLTGTMQYVCLMSKFFCIPFKNFLATMTDYENVELPMKILNK